jgi:hypothetical protein
MFVGEKGRPQQKAALLWPTSPAFTVMHGTISSLYNCTKLRHDQDQRDVIKQSRTLYFCSESTPTSTAILPTLFPSSLRAA